MTLIPIVCTNCGAKYRLPENFKSDKAKCKKCGTQIDVAAQRNAAAEPAPEPEPEPDRAAPERESHKTASSRAERPSRAGTTRRSGSRTSSRRNAGSTERSGRRSRRGQAEEEQKKGKGMLIGLGVGAVAIVVVGLILMTGGGDDEGQVAETPAIDPAAQQAAETEAARLTEEQAQQQTLAAAEAVAAADAAAAAEAVAEAEADAAAAEAAAVETPANPGEPWLDYTVDAVEDVFDPKTETEPLPWPEYVTEEERLEITDLIAQVENGGIRGTRAKTRLEELGHKSLTGIINRLRHVDYTSSEENFFAYELNKLIERVTITINANFQIVEFGSAMDLRIAHWNAKTVQPWIRFMTTYATAEDFDRLIKSIKARPNR